MKLKTICLGAVGVLGLGALAMVPAPNYNKKFKDLVTVPAESTMLWNIKNQQDYEGDRLISPKVSWSEFSYDAYMANNVKNGRALEKIIRKTGEIYLPREDINPKYND